MKMILVVVLLLVGAVDPAAPAERQRVVTIFDAVEFINGGTTPQSAQAVVPTGKFGHVTLVSQLTDVTNQFLTGFSVACTFMMAESDNPANTPSVLGMVGTIGRGGFVYSSGEPPTPVLGPYLFCRTAPAAGDVASKLTLKAVFTK